MRSRSLGFGLFVALGVLAVVPAEREAEAAPPGWETSWDNAWSRATKYYSITAAPTVASDAACQGDLGFNPRVKELTRAIAARRYGEATRLIGVIQDKSTCLTLEGARGLEYALAGWIHYAMRDLSGADQEIAVHGALNAAALAFDSLQYTRRSWLLHVVAAHGDKLEPIAQRYPKNDLGFYAFDWGRGTLTAGVDPGALVRAMRDAGNFGDGSCALVDMAAASYVCKGWVGKSGMGGGGAGGAAGAGGAVGGLPGTGRNAGSMSCIIDAAKGSGARGTLGCAAKAVAGMTFDPRTASATSLMNQGILGGQPAVRDPNCARSADAGNGGAQQDPEEKKKEPSTWDKLADKAKSAAGAVKDYAVAVVDAVFNKTPVGLSEASQLASPEGADAVRGGLQAAQAMNARNELLSDNEDAIDRYNAKRDGRVVTNPQANQRTAGDLPSGPLGGKGGGACGRGSNAARRANALYDCMTGGGPKPTNRGPNNPLVSMTDPGQVQAKPTGALACMQQGGDLPRTALMDMKCANARCVEGALSCPCDRSGAGNAAVQQGLTPRLTATTSPNCAEPGCNPGLPRPGGGTLTGPGAPPPPGGTLTGPGPGVPKP